MSDLQSLIGALITDSVADLIADRVADRVAERLRAGAVAAPADDYLTPKEAATVLKLSWKRLETLRREGGGPAYSKPGGRIRYKRSDLDAWLTSKARRNTSQRDPS